MEKHLLYVVFLRCPLPGARAKNWKLPLSFNNSSTDQNGRKNSSEKQKGDPNWAEYP
jgi:hypothetical protein